MAGKKLTELNFTKETVIKHFAVKESVFPFIKFPDVDTLLGPEMKSTGEVMGLDDDLAGAFAKAQIAAGNNLPIEGNAFVSINDEDKPKIIDLCRKLNGI